MADEQTEAAVVAKLAQQATEAQVLEPGLLYLVPDERGVLRLIDTEEYDTNPRRVSAKPIVRDPASFLNYFDKHHTPDDTTTEVWADREASTVLAIFDAERAHTVVADERAGWHDHRLSLTLRHTPAWTAWLKNNGKLLRQVEFAEHIEDRAVDIVEPVSAEVLEIAQSFKAVRKVDFESGSRLSNGEMQFRYKEDLQGSAGKKGELTIPDVIKLGLRPFEDGELYGVKARLRWRISDQELLLGYQLERPEDVLIAAFDDIVKAIDAGIPDDVHVHFGKP